MSKILYFIQYHNAFTIVFVTLFFGFSVSFAASPEMREAIYSSTETVVSVDNGALLAADLNAFNFNLRIRSVTEDEQNYYAAYSYQTFAIEDGVWQAKETEKIMTVSKEALGGRDLGLYLAEELGENINAELAYLKRVQQMEREKGEAQKVVAVEYAGLIGRLLDPSENVIEGYEPVIPEPLPEVSATVEENPTEVIVSTPYAESQPESAQEPISDSASSTISEQTNSSPTASSLGQASLPAPEDMVDEGLIQNVVDDLLQDRVTSDSSISSEATSTPGAVSEPVIEAATSTSEIIPEPTPEPAPEAGSVSEAGTELPVSEPVSEPVAAPETVSEPTQ